MTRPRRRDLTQDEDQRAFHLAVPDWDASVAAERERLGYRPEWRPALITDWDGQRPRPPFWEWRSTTGRDLEAIAIGEVERLGLPVLSPWAPGAFGFVRYWLACLLSDYDVAHLSHIQDWPRAIGGEPGLERVYPPKRETLVVTVTGDNVREAAPTLTIRGPVGLVSRDTLTDAVERALRLVERGRAKGTWPNHPVLSRRKTRAATMVRGRLDDRHALAVALAADGKSSGEIADEIARRPDLGPSVDASTIRRWLRRGKLGIS